MILDRIERLSRYKALVPKIDICLDFLKQTDALAPGRYDFTGGYCLVHDGLARPPQEAAFESHRCAIDIQCILDGAEYLEWADVATLTTDKPYDPQTDLQFYTGKGTMLRVSAGTAHIQFPNDGHRALFYLEAPLTCRKVTFKIKTPSDEIFGERNNK